MSEHLFERFLTVALATGMAAGVTGCHSQDDMSKVQATAIKSLKPLLNKKLDDVQGVVEARHLDITDTSPVTKRVIEIENTLCHDSEITTSCFTEAVGDGFDKAQKNLRRNVNAITKNTSADEDSDTLDRRRQALWEASKALDQLANPKYIAKISADRPVPQGGFYPAP